MKISIYKVIFIFFLIIISLNLISCTKSKSIENNKEIPTYVISILKYIDILESKKMLDDSQNDLISFGLEEIKKNPDNAIAYILLAQSYGEKKDYYNAIKCLNTSSELDPNLSDPHFGLSDIYYNIALIDITVRNLYNQHEKGFFIIKPDEISKKIFIKAIEEFRLGKSLPKVFEKKETDGLTTILYDVNGIENRIRQASIYIGNAPEEALFTEDQCEIIDWILLFIDAKLLDSSKLYDVEKAIAFFATITNDGKNGISSKMQFQLKEDNNPNYIEALFKEEIEIIHNKNLKNINKIDAVLNVAYFLGLWNYLLATSKETYELENSEQISFDKISKIIIDNVSTIDIELDEAAILLLHVGKLAKSRSGYLMNQIEKKINDFGKESLINRIFLITWARINLFLVLTSGEFDIYNICQDYAAWDGLRNLALNMNMEQKKINDFDAIRQNLMIFAKSFNNKKFNEALSQLNDWCNRLLVHIIEDSLNNVYSELPKPYVGPTIGDTVWDRTEKEIQDYKSILKQKKDPNPQIHFLLGFAYHQRGMLKEAKNEYQIALTQDPKYSDANGMLSAINAHTKSIEENLDEIEKALEELIIKLDQKGVLEDKYSNSIKGAFFQTKSYLLTLIGIAEWKIRIHVTTGDKKGLLMLGVKSFTQWKECLSSYGAKLQWNYKDNFNDELLKSLTIPEPVQIINSYTQIKEGIFKGAFIDKDQKIIIPGLLYYQDILSKIDEKN